MGTGDRAWAARAGDGCAAKNQCGGGVGYQRVLDFGRYVPCITLVYLYIEKKKKDDAVPGIRAYKNSRVNGFTKTVTPHLRSIGPNVQRHMAYFAAANESVCV